MISIIVCSRNQDIPEKLKQNIAKTIGVEYELVVIDNSKNNYSIFSAYNEGVRRAKYPYLCFMHDDILYHTENWGKRVIEHFQDDKVGAIGTCGTHFLPKTPTGWYQTKVNSGGGLQRIKINGKENIRKEYELKYIKNKRSIQAVVVDGLWFCIPTKLFEQIKFDDKTFNGFHCYDMDICLQIRNLDLQIKIISDILIEHFSLGCFDIDWIKNTNLFFNKWKNSLPQVAGVLLSEEELKAREEIVSETFVWMTAYAQSQKELENIRKSKAYLIGKFLIKPFSIVKNILYKK